MHRNAVVSVAVVALVVLAGCSSGIGPGGSAGAAGDAGTVDFYVSDERNAIDDFRHLNVTVTRVGFQRGGESGNWSEHGVDNRTVDLTAVQGDTATLLETFDVPAGNYTKVFVHVGAVNGTLTDGSAADVKLPSEKLQLNERFRVEANSSVDFVYDITVVKRGKSGSYNIKPVASASGTDVPIRRVDDAGAENESDDAPSLEAAFVGRVAAGENATVRVTREGERVTDATVTYDGMTVETGDEGEATVSVPPNATDVIVTVAHDGEEVELERGLAVESDPSGGGEDEQDDQETV